MDGKRMNHHHLHLPRGPPPPAAVAGADDFVIVRQTLSPASSSLHQGRKYNGKNGSTSINDDNNDQHYNDHHHQSPSPNVTSSRPLNLAKNRHFEKILSSSSTASDQPLLLQLISSGSAKTASEQQGQPSAAAEADNGISASFWTRRSMFTTIFISLTLLFGIISLVHTYSNDGNNNGGTDELLGGDDDGITQLLSDDDAKGYLNRFGYIDAIPSTSSQETSAAGGGDEPRVYAQQQQHQRKSEDFVGELALDSIRSAVRKFQEFAGLPTTGDLDIQTKKKMAQPRCGIQDVQMLTRGDHVLKWRKRRITFKLMQSTNDIPARMQKQAIQMAFDTWSKIVPLDFGEATGYDTPDVKVLFARRSHGDPWPFDGRGGVLAHATFPQDGKLHFDDDENWVFMDGQKIGNHRFTDLYWVSLHEIGHVLGLSHSNIETAIMAPFYQDPRDLVDWRGNYKRPELTQDDVRAAQQIYGKRYGRLDTSTTTSSRDRSRETLPPAVGGGGRRKSNSGTYDDSEGGFWSQFGKIFSTDDDNNANRDRHSHGRNHARRDHQHHQHSHNYEKQYDEMDNSATAKQFKFSILLLAPLICITVIRLLFI